jgi:DNA ligase-1
MIPLVLLIALLLAPAAVIGEVRPPPVMGATAYAPGVDVSRYWVSEKLDGVRGHWDGERLRTRGGHVIEAPAWFIRGWPSEPMDGELWMGRGRFAEVSGIARRHEPRDADWRRVRFMVFDLPAHGGRFDDRVRRMRALLRDHDIPWLRPVRQFRVAGAAELDRRLERVVAAGGEGLMLHHEDARYATGRSAALMKYKPFHDAEALVVGHTPGKGRFKGMLGALVVERPDGRRFRIGTGFTDAERADPPAIGSRITYRYSGYTANGFPRFARFLRVRPRMPESRP